MRLSLAINPYRTECPINYRRDSFTTKWTIVIRRWLNKLIPPCTEAEDTRDSDNWEQWTRMISVGDMDEVLCLVLNHSCMYVSLGLTLSFLYRIVITVILNFFFSSFFFILDVI